MIFHNGSDWRWISERRDHYNLWISLKGQGRIEYGSTCYDVGPWTVFLFPPEQKIRGMVNEPREEVVNFSLHWLPGPRASLKNEPLPLGLRLYEVDTAQSLIQLLVRHSVQNDDLAAQQLEWAALSLLALVWREWQSPVKSQADRWIEKQIEQILSGGDLFRTTSELAAEAGLSRAHYSRCFSRITSISPNRFLLEQRVRRACNLLRQRDWTIATVAEKVGYSDVYFFSRQFKRLVGQTPSQYRALERG